MRKQVPVVVLASGGIDSAALLELYTSADAPVSALHFQYHQKSAKSELTAFNALCKHYAVQSKITKLGFKLYSRGHELLGRNAIFSIVAASLNAPPMRIAIGIHRGTNYYDCSKQFVSDTQKLLDGYFTGTVAIEAPFIDQSKGEVISFCKRHRVPLRLTYSCQAKNTPPCGKCPSCLDRMKFLGDS